MKATDILRIRSRTPQGSERGEKIREVGPKPLMADDGVKADEWECHSWLYRQTIKVGHAPGR